MTAGNNGGVKLAYNRIIIEVTNSCFLNNVASNNGGVLYAYYRSSVTIRRSSFDNNRAGYDVELYMYLSVAVSPWTIASLATMKLVMMVE